MAEVKRYRTPVFRLSFPSLFEASSFEGGPPKYSCSAIWMPDKFSEKEKELWATIKKAINAECLSRFKKSFKDLKALNAEGGNFKLVPRDGKTKADLEGYGDGTFFANLTTKMRPGLIDAKKLDILSDAEKTKALSEGKEEGEDFSAEEIFPGCYCRATVTVYSYDNKGKGVALGLMNVQKIADALKGYPSGRLDSRTNAAEDFDDEIDEAWLEQDEDEIEDDDPF